MHSPLFDQANLEVQAQQRFALQNPQKLRDHLGGDVLAVKGALRRGPPRRRHPPRVHEDIGVRIAALGDGSDLRDRCRHK